MSSSLRTLALAIMTLQLATQTSLHAGSSLPSPSAKDKCPVCGMFVGNYQNWLSSVRLENGSVIYFDGPKDLFSYYLHPGKFAPTARQSEMAEITVKDYYSLKPIDARKAYFVAGSNVLGPMGKELIPLSRKSDAMGFMKDHRGKSIYRFNEITPATLKSLE